jgi:DNA-binding response OmpR family regulator
LTTAGILLAEDDTQIRTLLVEVLRNEGYTVYDAPDGEEAIQLFDQNSGSIGLLLLDLGLPKRTGVEVFRDIRSKKPDVKIIAMSGWGQRETVDELYQEGVDIFIQKPYRPSEILQTVKNILHES